MILSDGRVRFTKNIQQQNANSLDVLSFEWQNSELSLSFSLTGMDMVPGKHWIWPLKAAHICTDASRHLTKIIWRSFWRYVSQNYVMRFKPVAFLLIKCQAKNKYNLTKVLVHLYLIYRNQYTNFVNTFGLDWTYFMTYAWHSTST